MSEDPGRILEAATRTIADTEIIRLSVEGQRQMAAPLFHPPVPGDPVRKAFRRRGELLSPARRAIIVIDGD